MRHTLPPVTRFLAIAALVGLTFACASVDQQAGFQDSAALAALGSMPRPPADVSSDAETLGSSEQTQLTIESPVTREQALAMVLQHNPSLRAEARQIRVWEARRVQAETWANPYLSLSGEDFLGSGAFRAVDEMQVTAELSQELDLVGKRGHQSAVAAQQRDAAGWQLENARWQLVYEANVAFNQALLAQRRVALSQELADLARQASQVLASQAEAGRVTEMEVERAQVTTALAEMDVQEKTSELLVAKGQLAALWGGTRDQLSQLQGSLEVQDPGLDDNSIQQAIDQHPRVAKMQTLVKLQQARIKAAQAQAIPDLNVMLGYRYLNGPGASTVVSGLGVALPVFDRGQNEIQALEHERAAAEDQLLAERNSIREAVQRSVEKLRASLAASQVLEQKVLPRAESTFLAIQEGVQIGRFGFLDLLEAQRTLFQARRQHLELKAASLQAQAELELHLAKVFSLAVAVPQGDLKNASDVVNADPSAQENLHEQ